MQRVAWLNFLSSSLNRHPNVGRLVELCEENYLYLRHLLPDLSQMQGAYRSPGEHGEGQAELLLNVLEHTRYTSLIHLTHYFTHASGKQSEPDALLRVYHDAKQVEVIDLRQSSLPLNSLYEAPGLLNKWQVNLFVSKWLAFCVQQGHVFEPDVSRCERLCERSAL